MFFFCVYHAIFAMINIVSKHKIPKTNANIIKRPKHPVAPDKLSKIPVFKRRKVIKVAGIKTIAQANIS